MTPYYMGCLLGDVRGFADWAASAAPEQRELPDDTVVYLREDLAVVRHPVRADQGVLWDSATTGWRVFCTDELRFDPPAGRK
ncbi:hypothetical protein ACIBKX_10255 [Streptomyces sp. NPDC050658]|uniref:hypothetical protein n=1 Tax=unclassified Streptomyces TaxID=2593676 RepID=UPI003435AD0D